MGYYEKESAPDNLRLPTPVQIPRDSGWLQDVVQEATARVELQGLIDKLNVEEVKNVTEYVANLLLVGVTAVSEGRGHNGPRC